MIDNIELAQKVREATNVKDAAPTDDDLLTPKPERRRMSRHTDRTNYLTYAVVAAVSAILGAVAVNLRTAPTDQPGSIIADTETTNIELTQIKGQLVGIRAELRQIRESRINPTASVIESATREPEQVVAERYRVTVNNANVRSGPSTDFEILRTLQTGDSIVVTDVHPGSKWYSVAGQLTGTGNDTVFTRWETSGYIAPSLVEIE